MNDERSESANTEPTKRDEFSKSSPAKHAEHSRMFQCCIWSHWCSCRLVRWIVNADVFLESLNRCRRLWRDYLPVLEYLVDGRGDVRTDVRQRRRFFILTFWSASRLHMIQVSVAGKTMINSSLENIRYQFIWRPVRQRGPRSQVF